MRLTIQLMMDDALNLTVPVESAAASDGVLAAGPGGPRGPGGPGGPGGPAGPRGPRVSSENNINIVSLARQNVCRYIRVHVYVSLMNP